MNKIRRILYFQQLTQKNMHIARDFHTVNVAKIALVMLCLGEASKYSIRSRTFSLGNSDARIIILFLGLIRLCFPFSLEKVRESAHCRADQNVEHLEQYWQQTTGIPKRLFYKTIIDLRSLGKPTRKTDYKGVLRMYYYDAQIQHELENLADSIHNQVQLISLRKVTQSVASR